MICTAALVPIRFAPAATIAATSAALRMPPEAFTPARSPTTPRINATSSAVAPPPNHPVEVLTKSAPPRSESSQARILFFHREQAGLDDHFQHSAATVRDLCDSADI